MIKSMKVEAGRELRDHFVTQLTIQRDKMNYPRQQRQADQNQDQLPEPTCFSALLAVLTTPVADSARRETRTIPANEKERRMFSRF